MLFVYVLRSKSTGRFYTGALVATLNSKQQIKVDSSCDRAQDFCTAVTRSHAIFSGCLSPDGAPRRLAGSESCHAQTRK